MIILALCLCLIGGYVTGALLPMRAEAAEQCKLRAAARFAQNVLKDIARDGDRNSATIARISLERLHAMVPELREESECPPPKA